MVNEFHFAHMEKTIGTVGYLQDEVPFLANVQAACYEQDMKFGDLTVLLASDLRVYWVLEQKYYGKSSRRK
jgi:hypothetical protein